MPSSSSGLPAPVPAGRAWRVLLLCLACGLLLFVWQLGSTGLVDETPPLFAASARAMAERGDWLIPQVNGLPRYDKPPLVYWAMGAIYALPAQAVWDPLGSWAARLPSALACIAVMLGLTATLLRWPQGRRRTAFTALTAALAFALSPLVLLWGRIAVSDALFSGCVAISLLLSWRCYAQGGRRWWWSWLVLGLAVLAKGPVALVLCGLTLVGFGWLQADLAGLRRALRPLPGLVLCLAVALPWYGAAWWREGEPFWRSFFGYHNLQRFTGVVNNHLQPWWFFLPVLVVASLPFTPLLLAGLVSAARRCSASQLPEHSLQRFATCWLVAVLLFFTLAATKLPSYWIPATPAAGLLIALAAQQRPGRWLMVSTLLLQGVLAAGLAASGRWVPLIHEPELPTLPAELLASGLLSRASACFALALLAGLILWWAKAPWRWGWLLAQQLAVAAFAVSALQPLVVFGDRLRQAPLRRLAAAVQHQRRSDEPLAMVGILKPSLHFYTNQVVIYEGVQPNGPLNLNDRLLQERRREQTPSPPAPGRSVLLVIDQRTAQLPHWRGLSHQALASEGLFELWRVPRQALDQWAAQLKRAGTPPADWQQPRPERY